MGEKINKLLSEVFEKHRNNLEEWREGLLEEDTAIIPNNNLEDFLDNIVEKIADFGYGETYFHTADIDLMRKVINKLVEELTSQNAEVMKDGT